MLSEILLSTFCWCEVVLWSFYIFPNLWYWLIISRGYKFPKNWIPLINKITRDNFLFWCTNKVVSVVYKSTCVCPEGQQKGKDNFVVFSVLNTTMTYPTMKYVWPIQYRLVLIWIGIYDFLTLNHSLWTTSHWWRNRSPFMSVDFPIDPKSIHNLFLHSMCVFFKVNFWVSANLCLLPSYPDSLFVSGLIDLDLPLFRLLYLVDKERAVEWPRNRGGIWWVHLTFL